MVKNKRGWILILESVIAVLILFSFLFFMISSQKPYSEKSNLYDLANILAEKIEKNDSLRALVFQNNAERIDDYLNDEIENMQIKRTNAGVCIAEYNENCFIDSDNEIFVSEAIIASNSTHYDLKKVRVFVWKL